MQKMKNESGPKTGGREYRWVPAGWKGSKGEKAPPDKLRRKQVVCQVRRLAFRALKCAMHIGASLSLRTT